MKEFEGDFMKLALILLLVSTASFAASFKCVYKEHGKKVFTVSGKLDEEGGKLKMRGAYVFGDNKTKKKQFYRYNRKNEADLEFAKFTIKSPEEREKGVFLTPFYRLSIPKTLIDGSHKGRKFDAYFGFHTVELPDTDVLEELPKMSCRKRLL